MAILDEIQRVVAGYHISQTNVSRVNLLAGNDQHLEIEDGGASLVQKPEFIAPANNDLFRTQGTLRAICRQLTRFLKTSLLIRKLRRTR